MEKDKNRPYNRILKSAGRLFMIQGYQTTGINRIISESNTAKASFYHYFPSKEDLAIEYIIAFGNEQMELFRKLMMRNDDPLRFMAAWAAIVTRKAKQNDFYGCLMGNLRAQIGDETHDENNKENTNGKEIKTTLENITKDTLELIENYLGTAQQNGKLSKTLNAKETSRKLMLIYEGTVQMFRLTNKIAVFKDMIALSESVLRNTVTGK